MNINVATNISKEFKNTEVIINTPEITEDVKLIIDSVMSISKSIKQIIGIKENKISLLTTDEIMCFYSEEKNNYCKTSEGRYRIKEKLYELEENLCKR